MGVQKRKTSKGRRDRRRSQHKVSVVLSIECPKCGNQTRPHTICQNCNNYVKNPRSVTVQNQDSSKTSSNSKPTTTNKKPTKIK